MLNSEASVPRPDSNWESRSPNSLVAGSENLSDGLQPEPSSGLKSHTGGTKASRRARIITEPA